MVPTSLPELPKPSRTPGKSQNLSFRTRIFREQIRDKSLLALLTPSWGDPSGEMDQWTMAQRSFLESASLRKHIGGQAVPLTRQSISPVRRDGGGGAVVHERREKGWTFKGNVACLQAEVAMRVVEWAHVALSAAAVPVIVVIAADVD